MKAPSMERRARREMGLRKRRRRIPSKVGSRRSADDVVYVLFHRAGIELLNGWGLSNGLRIIVVVPEMPGLVLVIPVAPFPSPDFKPPNCFDSKLNSTNWWELDCLLNWVVKVRIGWMT